MHINYSTDTSTASDIRFLKNVLERYDFKAMKVKPFSFALPFFLSKLKNIIFKRKYIKKTKLIFHFKNKSYPKSHLQLTARHVQPVSALLVNCSI